MYQANQSIYSRNCYVIATELILQMEKYCTPEFIFSKVITYSPHWLTVFSIVVGWPLIGFYGIYGYRYLGMAGMGLTVVLFFVLMKVVTHVWSKQVIIYFDRKRMYVATNGRNFKDYLKRDIKGVYSHNYDERARAYTSISILFKNGTYISINDTTFGDAKDDEKAQMLKQFLKTIKRQLDFDLIKKNKWRAFRLLGPYWYSRDETYTNLSVDIDQ